MPAEAKSNGGIRTGRALRFPFFSDHSVPSIFFVLLLVKAVIAFLVLPSVTTLLGSNYQADLFPDRYDLIAGNLVDGNGYRMYPDTSLTMIRSPGFIVILAGIFALFGKSLLAVQVAQFFMSAIIAMIIYVISYRILLSKLVSLIAVTIFLFHPVSMISDTRGGTDTTLALCLTATLLLLFQAIESMRAKHFVFAGLALGYTMLVKASVAFILPSIFLFLVLFSTRGKHPLTLTKNFLLLGLAASVVMTPWIVRNFEISGEFVPTMTSGPMAVFQGEEGVRLGFSGKDSWVVFNEVADEQNQIGHEMGLRMREDFFPQFYDIKDEVNFYNELGRRAWAEYRANPTLLARAMVHNSWAFWFQGRTEMATFINIIIMVPFICLSAYGGFVMVRQNKWTWLLIVSVVAFYLPHIVILAVARYSAPLIPIMAILSAGALHRLLRHSESEAFTRGVPV